MQQGESAYKAHCEAERSIEYDPKYEQSSRRLAQIFNSPVMVSHLTRASNIKRILRFGSYQLSNFGGTVVKGCAWAWEKWVHDTFNKQYGKPAVIVFRIPSQWIIEHDDRKDVKLLIKQKSLKFLRN